jgi:hypothetical protein
LLHSDPSLWSRVVGVGHPAICTVSLRFAIPCPCAFFAAMYFAECAGK